MCKKDWKHQTLIESKQKEAKLLIGGIQIGETERVALDYAVSFEIKIVVSAMF